LLTLMKLMIIIVINCFVIIFNFHNCFEKALTEIFQFRRALLHVIGFIVRNDNIFRYN